VVTSHSSERIPLAAPNIVVALWDIIPVRSIPKFIEEPLMPRNTKEKNMKNIAAMKGLVDIWPYKRCGILVFIASFSKL
jgi:hypothetical protein